MVVGRLRRTTDFAASCNRIERSLDCRMPTDTERFRFIAKFRLPISWHADHVTLHVAGEGSALGCQSAVLPRR